MHTAAPTHIVAMCLTDYIPRLNPVRDQYDFNGRRSAGRRTTRTSSRSERNGVCARTLLCTYEERSPPSDGTRARLAVILGRTRSLPSTNMFVQQKSSVGPIIWYNVSRVQRCAYAVGHKNNVPTRASTWLPYYYYYYYCYYCCCCCAHVWKWYDRLNISTRVLPAFPRMRVMQNATVSGDG
jgi:hypothetical protein